MASGFSVFVNIGKAGEIKIAHLYPLVKVGVIPVIVDLFVVHLNVDKLDLFFSKPLACTCDLRKINP